ncbi:MAG: sensor histidine kinase [Methylotenera sp.]|nr:sensor histidine kinase [Oligoflexia bacterium]
MRVWEVRANEEVLAALRLESLALRDSLPELLMQIVDALSTTIDRTEIQIRWDRSESLRIGRKHGRERAVNLDYTMDQMIFEYHILRQVICDVMEETRPLKAIEREVIVCAIEQAVNDAATQFSDTLRELQEKLASALTHDMRGPVTSAKINAQMILRRPDDQELSRKAATRISAGMDRLDAMIRDLLDASLIRAGNHASLIFEEYDLAAMTREIAEDFNITYGDRFVVVADSPTPVFWSKTAVHRVVENLATNAAKYGAPDTPITLTIEQTPSQVMLSVHNQGNPIPREEQASLFQAFSRAESAKGQPGWGLGLTVVKGLTEAHHGKVSLESTEEKGTIFTVELPRDARPSG